MLVSEFRGSPGTWQASAADGSNPMWFGRRIVYWSTSQSAEMYVDVDVSSGSPVFSQPKRLFPPTSGSAIQTQANVFGYSTAKRAFIAVQPSGAASVSQLSFIVHWLGLVKGK